MAKVKKFELESRAPILDEEDEETRVAIDEGMRDAKAGRTVLTRVLGHLLRNLNPVHCIRRMISARSFIALRV